jgi:phosphoserine phosphatase RsbU/P
MTLAVAGHPPPVIAAEDQSARFAEIEVSPPVGTNFGVPRVATTVALAPGSVAVFYTDGLVERRGESLDVGLERLRNAVVADPPDRLARDIMRHLVGANAPEDDVALVVVRRSGVQA